MVIWSVVLEALPRCHNTNNEESRSKAFPIFIFMGYLSDNTLLYYYLYKYLTLLLPVSSSRGQGRKEVAPFMDLNYGICLGGWALGFVVPLCLKLAQSVIHKLVRSGTWPILVLSHELLNKWLRWPSRMIFLLLLHYTALWMDKRCCDCCWVICLVMGCAS